MRLLADENVPRVAVEALISKGHDVAWVRTCMPGSDDLAVLKACQDADRVLLTFDKDFGELVFRRQQAASFGVILFRLSLTKLDQAVASMVTILESRSDWRDHFSVVDEDRIRMISLPQ